VAARREGGAAPLVRTKDNPLGNRAGYDGPPSLLVLPAQWCSMAARTAVPSGT